MRKVLGISLIVIAAVLMCIGIAFTVVSEIVLDVADAMTVKGVE